MEPRPPRHPRRWMLAMPGLQLRLTAAFVLLAALALGLHTLFVGHVLVDSVAGYQGDLVSWLDEAPSLLLEAFGLSACLLLPVLVLCGILLTFPVAGPLVRFERYLHDVADGDQLGPCKIRGGDDLQSLCEAVNRATEPVRRRRVPPVEQAGEPGPAERRLS